MKRTMILGISSCLITILFSFSTYASDSFINFKLDDKIRIELPADWSSPSEKFTNFIINKTKNIAHEINMDTTVLDNGVLIIVSPDKSAVLSIAVNQEDTLKNDELKGVAKSDIENFNKRWKDEAAIGFEALGFKLIHWEDAKIITIGKYSAICYSAIRTTKNVNINKRATTFTFYFGDRILSLNYSYLSNSPAEFEPILDHILKSISI